MLPAAAPSTTPEATPRAEVPQQGRQQPAAAALHQPDKLVSPVGEFRTCGAAEVVQGRPCGEGRGERGWESSGDFHGQKLPRNIGGNYNGATVSGIVGIEILFKKTSNWLNMPIISNNQYVLIS